MLLDRPEIDVNQACTERNTGTALTAAVRSNKIEFVELLLARKELDINATPVTPHLDMFTLGVSFFLMVLRNYHTQLCKLLFKKIILKL